MSSTPKAKKLKVALILSGQPRFHIGKSYDSTVEKIIKPYDADVYQHAWIDPDKKFEYPAAAWSNIKGPVLFPETIKDDLLKMYNPKGYKFEPPKKFEEFFTQVASRDEEYLSRNMPSMFYSLQQSDLLRQESKVEYDFVIRSRTDKIMLEDLPDLNTLKRGVLYIPDDCPNPKVFNDNFSICSGSIATTVYDVYGSLVELSKENNGTFVPEILWTAHLAKNKIPVSKINLKQAFARSW